MDQDSSNNQPTATLTRDDERALTRHFVESDFYRLIFKPKLKEVMEMAHWNAFLAMDQVTKCWWVEHEKALWNIDNVWLKNWLAIEEEETDDSDQGGYG